MAIYLLKPICSVNSVWGPAEFIQYLIIKAINQQAARNCAAEYAILPAKIINEAQKISFHSEGWLNEQLASCEEINESDVNKYKDYAVEKDRSNRSADILKEGPRVLVKN